MGGVGWNGMDGACIHEAVPHCLRRFIVDAIFASGREEVSLPYFVGPDAFCDSDHPEELVDVVA